MSYNKMIFSLFGAIAVVAVVAGCQQGVDHQDTRDDNSGVQESLVHLHDGRSVTCIWGGTADSPTMSCDWGNAK